MLNRIIANISKFADKLRTSLARRMILVKFGKGYRHIHPYWPFMKINFKEDGRHEIVFKGKKVYTTKSFKELKNRKYDEIVVFGAGPSVKQMDISKVKPETAILVNGAMALANKLKGGPLMCAVFDYAFLWDKNCSKMLDDLPVGTKLLVSDCFLGYALRKNRHLLDKFDLYLSFSALHPYYKPERKVQQLPKEDFKIGYDSAFSYNPQKAMFDGGTILTWALQVAYYLRADTTYICGLDLGNFNEPHFYETEKNKIVSIGLLRDYQRIENFMRLASESFKEQNLKIYNCSPVTKLPYSIFPFSEHFIKK